MFFENEMMLDAARAALSREGLTPRRVERSGRAFVAYFDAEHTRAIRLANTRLCNRTSKHVMAQGFSEHIQQRECSLRFAIVGLRS